MFRIGKAFIKVNYIGVSTLFQVTDVEYKLLDIPNTFPFDYFEGSDFFGLNMQSFTDNRTLSLAY